MLEKPFLAEHLAGVGHEVAEQGELLGGQVEQAPSTAGLEAGGVDLQLPHPHQCSAAARVAPEEAAHTGEQLAEGERLHEVVVGSHVEPHDPIPDLVASGEHQDPR